MNKINNFSKIGSIFRLTLFSALLCILCSFTAFAGTLTLDESTNELTNATGSPMKPYYFNASSVLVSSTASGAVNTFTVPSSSAEYLYYYLYLPVGDSDTTGYLTANATVYDKTVLQKAVASGTKIEIPYLILIGLKPGTTVTLNIHVHTIASSTTYSNEGTKCIKTVTQKCTGCGALSSENSEEAEHVAGKVESVAATCTSPAQTNTYCKNCGYLYKTETTGSTTAGHDYSVYEQNPYSYSQHKVKCKNCSSYKDENHTLNSSGVCTKCGYKYTGGSYQYIGPVSLKYLNVTALTSSLVNITFGPDTSNTNSGTCKFEIYAGNKKVKTVSNTGKNFYYVKYSAKNASKAKYKVVVVDCKDSSLKVSSAAKKAVSNNKTLKYSFSLNPRSTQYKSLGVFWRPSKIVKSGNKITVTGGWLSSHIVKIKGVKTKVTITYQGQDGKTITIGSKTLKASKMKAYYKKSTKWTFKLSSSKLKSIDLQNGGTINWTSKLLSWGY